MCVFEKYTKSAIRLGGSSFVERTSSSDGIHRVQLERDWKWKLLLFFGEYESVLVLQSEVGYGELSRKFYEKMLGNF